MVITYRDITDSNISAARAYALQHSHDFKRPTGAVITTEGGMVLAMAANQSGLGRNFITRSHSKWCLRSRVPSGQRYWQCPACVSPSNHAEARAASIVKREHGTLESLRCYLWGHDYACKSCLERLEGVGVTELLIAKT